MRAGAPAEGASRAGGRGAPAPDESAAPVHVAQPPAHEDVARQSHQSGAWDDMGLGQPSEPSFVAELGLGGGASVPPMADGDTPHEWSLPRRAMMPGEEALAPIRLSPEPEGYARLDEEPAGAGSEDGSGWGDDDYDPADDPIPGEDDFSSSFGSGDLGAVLGEDVMSVPASLGECLEEARPYVQGAMVDGLEAVAREVIALRPSDADLIDASASTEELFEACVRSYGTGSRSIDS